MSFSLKIFTSISDSGKEEAKQYLLNSDKYNIQLEFYNSPDIQNECSIANKTFKLKFISECAYDTCIDLELNNNLLSIILTGEEYQWECILRYDLNDDDVDALLDCAKKIHNKALK